MLSADLKPWLLEVNSSPSLTANTREDYELKFGLVDDALTVLDMEKFFQGEMQEQVGGFDLVYNGAALVGGDAPGGSATGAGVGAGMSGASEKYRTSVPSN